jgi:hypothetical protein
MRLKPVQLNSRTLRQGALGLGDYYVVQMDHGIRIHFNFLLMKGDRVRIELSYYSNCMVFNLRVPSVSVAVQVYEHSVHAVPI